MARVVTFGEMMMRLTPPGYARFEQVHNFEAEFGGAEANISVLLARLGLSVDYVSKLPQNELAQAAVNQLTRYGVGTSKIVRDGERMGVYYMERGYSQRSSKVIYDRKYSAISLAKSNEFDWDSIFGEDTRYFVFTGITPALGAELQDACIAACKEAVKRGITVCCDINYRSKLWDVQTAGKVMGKLLQYVDICIVNEEHAKMLLGIVPSAEYVKDDDIDEKGYVQICNQVKERYNIKTVAITIRRTVSAADNYFSAVVYSKNETAFSRKHRISIVDRIGSGDSFTAGLLYCVDQRYNLLDTVEFAAAAAVLAHSVEGDLPILSKEEIASLAQGQGHGRTQR